MVLKYLTFQNVIFESLYHHICKAMLSSEDICFLGQKCRRSWRFRIEIANVKQQPPELQSGPQPRAAHAGAGNFGVPTVRGATIWQRVWGRLMPRSHIHTLDMRPLTSPATTGSTLPPSILFNSSLINFTSPQLVRVSLREATGERGYNAWYIIFP